MSLIQSLSSGVSALRSFSRGIEVIGDNIANVNTTAFKSSRVEYAEGFGNLLESPGGGDGASSGQVGGGVQVGAVSASFGRGDPTLTGRDGDLFINGDGFFTVEDAGSGRTLATRAGAFHIDDGGFLATAQGHRLQGAAVAPVTVEAFMEDGALSYRLAPSTPGGDGALSATYRPALGTTLINNTGGLVDDAEALAQAPLFERFQVHGDGRLEVFMSGPGGNLSAVTGQVTLAQFNDPGGLLREGNGLYSGFDRAGFQGASAPAGGASALWQQHLELSNVDLTSEFANIISTQRSFQAGARIITVSDDILQEVTNLKR